MQIVCHLIFGISRFALHCLKQTNEKTKKRKTKGGKNPDQLCPGRKKIRQENTVSGSFLVLA